MNVDFAERLVQMNQSTNPPSQVYVSLEFTPNPNTLKYSVNRELLSKGAANFTRLEDAKRRSPLAFKLLDVAGICGVMVGRDFITITKTEEGDWDVVHKSATEILEQHLNSGEPILVEDESAVNGHKGGGGEIEDKIRQILDEEIRPMIAMDGGDVTFDRYEDGVVYVYLQGACSGCPGATATLKMGIERRLQLEIPEIQEVVSI